MFKRLFGAALLFGMSAAAPPVYASDGCAMRTIMVERLQSKYSEFQTAGGLQSSNENMLTMLEIWSSKETGTFTVIMTNPQGVSCILAVGTDWFQKEAVVPPEGIKG